jgi:hypothetical protein
VTVTGTGSSTLTVTTTGSTSAGTSMPTFTGVSEIELALTWLAAVMALATNRKCLGRRLRPITFPGLCVALLLALCCGCGGNRPASMPHGTPAGTYQVSVTGSSGNISHSTVLSLTVK